LKIEIQNWWNAKIYTITETKRDIEAENTLKRLGKINICAIIIDGKVVGEAVWDGKELTISKELVEEEKTPLEALKQANKRNK